MKYINGMTVLFSAGFVLLSGCANMQPQAPDPEPVTYGKTFTLQNDLVKVVVAPEIGRIIHFSFVDGDNLIWLEDLKTMAKAKADNWDWMNWGGDKVWPAQQADWPFIMRNGKDWPPNRDFDGSPFKVIESGRGQIVIESPVDKYLHVRLRRTLTLDPLKPVLTIKNRLIQEAPTPWPVQIWSVTQCVPPEYTLLGIDDKAPDPQHPFQNLMKEPLSKETATVLSGALKLSPPSEGGAKAGTIGNWCASVYKDTVFLQTSDSPPDGCYPDGSSIEVFCGGNYIELEPLSSSKHLDSGESISNTIIWSLLKVSGEMTPAQVLDMVKGR